MPKLGTFEIPDISLQKCLDVSNVINMQKDSTIGREELSLLLTMSSRGGQFSKLIKSCKSWGLIDGRDRYFLTSLGVEALNPLNSSDLIIKLKELILNNSFFLTLFSNYPNLKHTDTSLLQTIEEITEVDRFTSVRHESLIRKLIQEVYLIINTSNDLPASSVAIDNELDINSIEQPVQKTQVHKKITILTKGVDISFQFSNEGINSAISLLNSLKLSI